VIRNKVLMPILGFVFLHIAIILPCNAYEDTETHPAITKKAIEAEACIINDYFMAPHKNLCWVFGNSSFPSP